MRRRVLVVGLGGTIAMRPASERDGNGVVPGLTPGDLVAAVPGLAEADVEIETLALRSLPGSAVSFADLDEVRNVVATVVDRGVDGVVMTQGTDTIEESAYYLDLHHRSPEPVVVTGAMRNPSLAGADGPANLLAAIQVAADPVARERGCLVVFADEIHAAARVRKTHTTSPATFRSPDGGPLGTVVEGKPRFTNDASARFVVPAVERRLSPRVRVVTVTMGDDASVLDGLSSSCDGVVLAAMGAGHVPFDLVEPLEELAAAMPVVLASRAGAGRVLTTTYGFRGSERDLLARRLISAGDLHPFKARVLLHSLLAAGCDEVAVREAFTEAAVLTT